LHNNEGIDSGKKLFLPGLDESQNVEKSKPQVICDFESNPRPKLSSALISSSLQ